MLDMYTTNGKFAFQFEDIDELTENQEDYGLEGHLNTEALRNPGGQALVVLTPSGKGGWHYRRVIGPDDLERALATAGLLPEDPG